MKDGKKSSGRMAGALLAGMLATGAVAAANAQMGPPGPPAVGVMEAAKRPITESNEFLGRVEATNRVNIVARVTAFLRSGTSPTAPRSGRATFYMSWNAGRSKPISSRGRPRSRSCRRPSSTPS